MSIVRKMNEIQWCCRLYNKRKKMLFSYNDLLGCFHTFFRVSVRYPLFHCWRFLRHTLGFTKVCWTKFYAITLTVFSRWAFSEFATQCSTQSFHEVAYLSIIRPVFPRFLRYWQLDVFRNMFACRFPRHAFSDTYLEHNPGREIAEAERKTFDELKSNYRQALISNYHDLVQMGHSLKKDPIHKQIVATAKRLRSEEDYDLAESYAWALKKTKIPLVKNTW